MSTPEDPDEYRSRSRERWERAAEGWGLRRAMMEQATRPVSAWLVDAIAPQPGQAVLELAAGPGDTGLLVAELLRPGGRLVATDGAEPMVELIRARARELGLADIVEARRMEAEWIDLSAASVDAVLCRWGFMLFADPDSALRETRRVLKPGGRVALAAWDGPERNKWSSAIGAELVARGLAEPPEPGAPGQFAWSDRDAIAERLRDAGFFDVVVDTIPFVFAYDDADAWWDAQIDLSMTLRDTLLGLDPAARDELMEACQARMAEHVQPDGRLIVPASTHVALAEA
jgi:SAM-dependent methyltransferase